MPIQGDDPYADEGYTTPGVGAKLEEESKPDNRLLPRLELENIAPDIARARSTQPDNLRLLFFVRGCFAFRLPSAMLECDSCDKFMLEVCNGLREKTDISSSAETP